jgi:hypothetical protein
VNAAFMSFQPHESGIHAVWSEASVTEVRFPCAPQAGGEALGSHAKRFRGNALCSFHKPRKRSRSGRGMNAKPVHDGKFRAAGPVLGIGGVNG